MFASKLSKNSTIKTKNLTTKTASHCGVIVGFFSIFIWMIEVCAGGWVEGQEGGVAALDAH